ncbi:hypothetical protein OAA91_00100, partial [Fibrobacterales bacterium]|nr:hypothetical protein [Fibrobacterales bacterium]
MENQIVFNHAYVLNFRSYVLVLLLLITSAFSLDTDPNSDYDKDGVSNALDLDDDNDGILDVNEIALDIYVEKSFSVKDGVTETFKFPNADKGFQFDIYSLDNSFNLQINGVKLVNKEIQLGGLIRTGDSKPVFKSDEKTFQDGTGAPIYGSAGNAATPLIRVSISEAGVVKIYGKRDGKLQEMKIMTGFPQLNNVTWSKSADNTVIMSQEVYGGTRISGTGSGIQQAGDRDTDADGILDLYDLDSDGDGCPDALEGVGTFNWDSLLTNNAFSGGVNAKGVPIKTGAGGQLGGSSYDAKVKDVDCVGPPKVTTHTASLITYESARLNGEVTASGEATITSRGFYWGITKSPSTKVTASGTIGKFGSDVSGLTAGIEYFFIAWATNAQGTSQGELKSFVAGEKAKSSSSMMQSSSSTRESIVADTGNLFLDSDVDGRLDQIQLVIKKPVQESEFAQMEIEFSWLKKEYQGFGATLHLSFSAGGCKSKDGLTLTCDITDTAKLAQLI